MAAVSNAIAYGLYTVVVIYMVCELPLWLKVIVVASCNFIGVLIVKWTEEKLRKDKLWKVEATISPDHLELIQRFLNEEQIPYNYIDINKYVVLNIYCESQKDSASVREVLNYFHAKYFVIEARTSLL